MTRLLLIRHASTHLAGTFCGHTDPWLNHAGYMQIDAMVDRLAAEPIEAIYTSDLLRAAHTAQVLASLRDVPLTRTPRLREIHFGDLEGLTWEQAEERFPAAARHWIEHHRTSAPPNGEPYPAFATRILSMVDEILHRRSGCVAIVTHAGCLQVVLEQRCGYTAQQAATLSKDFCCIIPVLLDTPGLGLVTSDRRTDA